MRIAVIDYGSGNLRSVSKAVEKVSPLGTEVLVTGEPEKVLKADRVIFPGQGAMPDCMRNLRETGMEEAVRESIRNKPFFAICVGEQMLFDHSEEGNQAGLGIFPGNVVRFRDDRTDLTGARLKVPQMGWNRISLKTDHPMWNGISEGAWFYFVHSYYVKPEEPSLVAATTFYGEEVTVAVARDNVFATQFHPEKSAASGLALYQNFLTWNP